ncbi:MAG: hypothetical protein AB1540_08485 [Bdellovibrionota bacterium]
MFERFQFESFVPTAELESSANLPLDNVLGLAPQIRLGFKNFLPPRLFAFR